MFNHMYIIALVLLCNTIANISAAKTKYVTCGSVLKLLNTDYRVRLHSHDVKYGTGSGQQSVTGTDKQEDVNSHWTILASQGKESCERGEPIKCGDTIRLLHIATRKNLHSHFFQSPLTRNQEISCYGENGVGDTGDNWEVECAGDTWLRDYPIKLRHMDTQSYLSVSGSSFGRPINGQMEVIGTGNSNNACEWKAVEGLFIHPRESREQIGTHDEL